MLIPAQAVNEAIHNLVQADYKRIVQIRTELSERNHALGNPSVGFMFAGEFHNTSPSRSVPLAERKIIHPDLEDDAREYVKDLKRIRNDRGKMINIISSLVSKCAGNKQDLRDMFPELLVPYFPDLASLPRTRKLGFLYEGGSESLSPIPDVHQRLEDLKTLDELVTYYESMKLLY